MEWKLVPVEMTQEMLAQGWLAAHRVMTDDRCNHEMMREAYRAMLAAAPAAPRKYPRGRPETNAEALDCISCLVVEHGDENCPSAEQAFGILRGVMGLAAAPAAPRDELVVWLEEREANARRIAATKSGDDKAGWLDDADRFKQAAADAVSLRARDRMIAARPAAPLPDLEAVLAAYRSAAPEFDAQVLQAFIDKHPHHADALRRWAAIELSSRPATREEVEAESAAPLPGELPDEEVLHLWDIHVGNPTLKYPMTDKDKVMFARAILARAALSVGEPSK